jgi:ATP-dependent DNA helicase RecG
VDAEAWLQHPDPVGLPLLYERGRALRAHVPEDRAKDFAKLLAGFQKDEPEERRHARVLGLIRACRLFQDVDSSLPWDTELAALRGVGPKTQSALAEVGISNLGQLVWLLPYAFTDLTRPEPLKVVLSELLAREAAPPATAPGGLKDIRKIITATVKSCGIIAIRGRKAVRLSVVDGSAQLTCFWFFMAHGVLQVAKPGVQVLLVGRIKKGSRGGYSMAHPDLYRDDADARRTLPRYAVPGVKGATLREATLAAISRAKPLPDPVPPRVAARNAMATTQALALALARLHGTRSEPPTQEDMAHTRDRLAWAEAFVRVWQRLTTKERAAKSVPLPAARAAKTRLSRELGFAWTKGQEKALSEIEHDLARAEPMRRLLLGDVGTGKTAVAFSAVAQAVAAKRQAAILAPTGILAEQYMEGAGPLARATGARIALCVGGMKASHKAKLAAEVERGAIDVVIGTHALLSQNLAFKDLALVVVDEQQRLGVAQRLSLVQKGKRPHLLSLSATPIPRTLALALLGDIGLSVIDERPKNRPPVTTEIGARTDEDAFIARVKATIAREERVFVIAPRVAASEDEEEDDDGPGLPLAAVELLETLQKKLPEGTVALVHGKLSFEEKRQIMGDFRAGKTKVLVGTTVLEVGVDVPEATLIAIVGAERFGLSQLHQLRGRVGRGAVPGHCLLLAGQDLPDVARARLVALATHDSGRDVARIDLELRGAGDLSGTEQSGAFSDFFFIDPLREPPWLTTVEGDAKEILAKDPDLSAPEHAALALLRTRFERLLAVREESG